MIKSNSEVEINQNSLLIIDKSFVERISNLAKENSSGKYRTCIHASNNDNVHEMLIAHTSNTYVRPHKHRVNGESLQFIEGEAVAIIFEDNGTIEKAFKVGCYDTNNSFYYSMSSAKYHMLIIQSGILIFKETVTGPFIRDDTIFPDWAPNGDDRDETNKYLSELMEEVNSILS